MRACDFPVASALYIASARIVKKGDLTFGDKNVIILRMLFIKETLCVKNADIFHTSTYTTI